jgi:7,8-dihydropterin-6-yl-methyl-4-(beta-D-ribofuranosyl)aminobenzene 5'-phosphate synthase
MSHGHADHHGGLEGVIKRIGRKRLPMILHPDIWLTRKVVFPTGAEINLPPPNRGDLEREEVEIVEERGPSLLLNSKILVTGQVERTTDFEKGFPPQRAFINGSWQPDQWVWDDQGVVVNVKNRGLVVLSSCSHAGSINVMRHARNITGVEKIYAFMGGMHLTGAIMEPLINPTLEAMADIKPDYVIPGHCTGWKAMHRLSSMLPEAYIQPSVGTRFQFS